MPKTPNSQPEESELEIRSSIYVGIEWGGRKPPATFYNRLHEYGLYSRHDKKLLEEVSLYEQRSRHLGKHKNDETHGLILQEGIITCSTASMAKAIMYQAKLCGAEHVWTGNITLNPLLLDARDIAIFDTQQIQRSKKGPKAIIEEGRYTVTCFDEARTFEVQSRAIPYSCPQCNSVRFDARLGKMSMFAWRDIADFSDLKHVWMATRFFQGKFEVPEFVENKKGHLATAIPMTIPQGSVRESYDVFSYFGNNEDQITSMFDNLNIASKQKHSRDLLSVSLHILDVMYAASKKTISERKVERLNLISDYWANGGTGDLDMTPPDYLDIMDLVQIDRSLSAYLP